VLGKSVGQEGGALNAGDRGLQRYRRAVFGGAAIMFGNGLKMLASLLILPFALHHLGAERFGIWATLTSLMTLAGIGDLGLGNGLINAIAVANGKDDRAAAQIYVSSVFFMTLLISAALLVVLLSLDSVVPWPSLFHLSVPAEITEARSAVTALTLCVILQVPLGVLLRIRAGFQEMHVNGLWHMLGTVLGAAAFTMWLWVGGSLPWLIAADAGGQSLAMIGNLGCLFLVDRPWLRPRLRWVKLRAARELLNLGILFFALSLLGVVAFYSDNLLAIWICGPVAAGLFAICTKLFSPCRLIAATLLLPLWPAYGEAITRGHIAWVRRTLLLSILVSVIIVSPLALSLMAFGNDLAGFWMHRPINFGFWLLSGMALWIVVETIGSAMSYFLNGALVMRVQLIFASIFAVVSILLKIKFAREFGIAGIPWGTLVAYTGVMLVPCGRVIQRHLRELAPRGTQEVR
jgi:O-antigen/teichoic acid export membrane protein